MKKKKLEEFNCSWAQAAVAIGDKWSIMIIRDAFFGVRTFSAFVKNIGIARNILSQRLEHLIQHGIIKKESSGLGSNRFEYSLTDKGHALLPLMTALGQWGDAWVLGQDNEPVLVVDQKRGLPIRKIEVESSQGESLSINDITFKAGPGASETTKQLTSEIADVLESS